MSRKDEGEQCPTACKEQNCNEASEKALPPGAPQRGAIEACRRSLLARAGPLDEDGTAWYYIYADVMGGAMESAITVKGQATIPKAIREHLGLKPGDRVKFFVHPDGSVVLLPRLPVTALRGMLKTRRRRPVTADEMTEAVAKSAARVRPAARR